MKQTEFARFLFTTSSSFEQLGVRQEINGPQAEQLKFIPCGQILQNSRREEKLSPAQKRDKGPHSLHSRSQGDLPDFKNGSLGGLPWGFPGGFPDGAVVESLPANAEDTGSNPGLGRSHMPRSNWAREPQLLSLRVWSLCSATREATIVRGPCTAMKSGPRSPQLEKALAQKRRPNTAKNK